MIRRRKPTAENDRTADQPHRPRAGEAWALDLGARASLWSRLRQTTGSVRLQIAIAGRAAPGASLLLLALVVVDGVLSPVQLWLVGDVVDRASESLPTVLLAVTAAVVGLSLAMPALTTLASSLISDAIEIATMLRVVNSVNGWPGLRWFEDPAFADDLERVRSASGRTGQAVMYVGRGVTSLMTLLSALVLLGRLQAWLPLALAAGQLPLVALLYRFNNIVGSSLYVQAPQARHLSYLRGLALSPAEAKDVRLAGMFGFLHHRYAQYWSASVAALVRLRHRLGGQVAAAGLLGGATAGAGFGYTVWLALTGSISVGELLTFAGGVTLLVGAISSLGFDIGFLPMVLAVLPALRRIIGAAPDLPVASRPEPLPASGAIRFEGVHFRYPGSDRDVLAGVTFEIEPGESLALVGHNGAGKTTIVKLLLRLYDPTAGRITFGGVDIRSLSPTDYRRALAVVFQDFGRYQLSARQNILLGQPDDASQHGRAVAAASHARIDATLDGLPSGFDTLLGKDLGETDLSGGQWQRLALARAFAREHARLLVLDEPTAQLDPRAEAEVFARFAELTAGRMTLLVSHRFSTVRTADRVVVIDQGSVREQGSHAELMARADLYARLYSLQAARYLDGADG